MTEPIRILQVLTIMNRGGAETMIMNYYRNIDRSRVQFDFMLHREERGVFDDEIEALGGKIYRMPKIRLHQLSPYLKSLDNFFSKHPEYKIVHSHINALSVFVLRAARKHKVPVRIAHSHTSLYSLNLNPFSKDRHSLKFAARFAVQNVMKSGITRNANHYFSCGGKAGVWLYGKRNIDKVQLLNNAIDTDVFVYDADKSQLMKERLNVSEKLVVGHVGNFVPEKNHGFILNTYMALRKLRENTALVLVGAYAKKELQRLVDYDLPEDVHVLGLRNDVPDVLQAMDVFLFPSTNEGLPLTLIEAQASGLVIKASANITREMVMTVLMEFISLNETPEFWAKRILDSFPYQRENTKDQIVKGSYDIENNVKSLQQFYIDELEKINE
ncbi:MAG: glycosyltransferase [Bacteroidia bacterium]|nr:glycosyltransferase [Bacteroidia bacterium]